MKWQQLHACRLCTNHNITFNKAVHTTAAHCDSRNVCNNYCCQHFVKDGSSMSPSTVSLCEITLQFTQCRYSSQLKTAFTTPSTTANAASSSFVTLHFSYTSSILSMCWMAYFAGTFRILWSAHLWLCSRFYTHKEGNMYSRHTGLELNWRMYFEVLHIPSTLLFFPCVYKLFFIIIIPLSFIFQKINSFDDRIE